MSVPVNERSHGKLEVCTKAHDLCCYTLQITKNKNIFVVEYQDVLTNRIISNAIEIHSDCWSANNIMVNNHDSYQDRKKLQTEAIRKCNDLLSMIDLSKTMFHLASKRVAYWGSLVIEVRNLIRAWRESDADRYWKYK